MYLIEWNGDKQTYRNVISPICYAYNLAERQTTDVQLVFRWAHEKGSKFKPSDKMSIDEVATWAAEHIEPPLYPSVHIKHEFGCVDAKHVNVDTQNFSDVRFMRNRWDYHQSRAIVVLVRPDPGVVREADDVWKDPVGQYENGWEEFINRMSRNGVKYEVVTYETGPEKTAWYMQRARLVIGYHGGPMHIAKAMGAPMLVVTKNDKHTKRKFPWALPYNMGLDIDHRMIDKYSSDSMLLLEQYEKDLNEFLVTPSIHRVR